MVIEKGAQRLLDRDHPGKIPLRNDSRSQIDANAQRPTVWLLPAFPSIFWGYGSAFHFNGKYCSMFPGRDRVFSGLGYFFDYIPPLDKCRSVNRPVGHCCAFIPPEGAVSPKKTIEDSTAEGKGHESIIRVPVACRSCTI